MAASGDQDFAGGMAAACTKMHGRWHRRPTGIDRDFLMAASRMRGRGRDGTVSSMARIRSCAGWPRSPGQQSEIQAMRGRLEMLERAAPDASEYPALGNTLGTQ
jgi:hypothetical protein